MTLNYGYNNNCLPLQVKKHYSTVFNINLLKAEQSGQADKGLRIGRVKDGEYSLFQNEYKRGPTSGLDFIQNARKSYMIFDCPEMMSINISVFLTLQVVGSVSRSINWGYIIGNDNGSYDKFIGYKLGTTDQLSYGGGLPTKEYNCTIQKNVNIFEKHLISCHWMLRGSCVYINGVKSVDSDFTANPKLIGYPFGTIFTNERLTGYVSPFAKSFTGRIFSIKIVKGFLEPEDIVNISGEIMADQKINQSKSA